MNKTIFLTIIAGVLAAIAILVFTSGCDSQPDAKTMQQETEASTTVAETTVKKADVTVATKPSETTKATTAAKEEKESQTKELNEEPDKELFYIEPEPDNYEVYYNESDYYESDYDNSDDYENIYFEYDDASEHVHSYRRNGVNTPHAHYDGYILYVCECGDSYKEPISCEGYDDHYEGDENLELLEVRDEIIETPIGEKGRRTFFYRCTICGAEIEVFYEDE